MDNTARKQGQPVARKVKKKQGKDELDRIKQAEKKKRRLEKALATSAAIRSELEKKKQKKKEEQQRLDEEGAAIAEAVALHVLLGEDSDDSCKIVLNEEKSFNPWEYASNIDLFRGGRGEYLPHGSCGNYAVQGFGLVSNAHGHEGSWSKLGNSDRSFFPGEPFRRDVRDQFYDDSGWGTMGLSAGLIAAQAVSSLQISEEAGVGALGDVQRIGASGFRYNFPRLLNLSE